MCLQMTANKLVLATSLYINVGTFQASYSLNLKLKWRNGTTQSI